MDFCNRVTCHDYSTAAAWNCGKGKDCTRCPECDGAFTLACSTLDGAKPAPQEDFFSKKFDKDKVRFDLLDPYFEEEVAKVLTFGAEKYSADSWQTVPDALARYTAALRRHLNAIQKGQYIDPDSKLPHHAHMSCNAMFISYLLRKRMDCK